MGVETKTIIHISKGLKAGMHYTFFIILLLWLPSVSVISFCFGNNVFIIILTAVDIVLAILLPLLLLFLY